MATYSINQMKKEIKKLEKLNIVGEKAILNVKVLDLKKLKEQEKNKYERYRNNMGNTRYDTRQKLV